MSVPSHPLTFMMRVYRSVFPLVHKQLAYWKERAEQIPNPELRKQALASIEGKTFHCEGGAVYALLSEHDIEKCIEFIVAYQTISDYLDNLCDRSTSQDPDDFTALHESMSHALSLHSEEVNYYRHRSEQEDGGYLNELVATCQKVLRSVNHYEEISPFLLELGKYYCELQVHKHVTISERIPRLTKWFQTYEHSLPAMEWYEFSACAGSTLGIFCLVAYAFQEDFDKKKASMIRKSYFPFIQGLHILLDYFIDQEEDKQGGDLNFCFYYPHETNLLERLRYFLKESKKGLNDLPDAAFHKLVQQGMVGVYLSDSKIYKQKSVRKIAKRLIKECGMMGHFFYLNGRAYRNVQLLLEKR